MTTTPAHLIRLMSHRPFRGKLGPEDTQAYAFANALRVAVLEGRLKAVFCHVANELAYAKGGKQTAQAGKARALGLITGTSDYLFLAGQQSLALEFKSDTGRLTEPQSDFAKWCRDCGVPYFIVRSAAAGLTILANHGVLEI